MKPGKPRIVLLDIETCPNIVYVWQLRQDKGYISHENIVKERTILCAAWKYLGEKKVHYIVAKNGNDRNVVGRLHEVLSGCDAVITHFGDRFDIPWIRTRALIHGMKPIPPLTQIDTYKLAKKGFNFNNSKLDYLGKMLGVGQKITTHFGLWIECMKGNKKAIREMVAYNQEDVRLLERVYLKLQPHGVARLNLQLGGDDQRVCPGCGERKLVSRGTGRTRATEFQRYQCSGCGAWSQKPKKSNVVR